MLPKPRLRLRFPLAWHTAKVCYKGLSYAADVNAVIRIEKGSDTLLVSGNVKVEQFDDYETPPTAFHLKIDGCLYGTNTPFIDDLILPNERYWSIRSVKKKSENCLTRCILLNVDEPTDWRECQITIRVDDAGDVLLSKAFVLALAGAKEQQECNHGVDSNAEPGLEPPFVSEQTTPSAVGGISTLGDNSLLDDIAPWVVLLVSIVVHILLWPVKKFIWLTVSIMVIIVRLQFELERRVDGFLRS